MNDLTPSISACVIVVVNDLGSSEGQITFSLNSKLCTQFWVSLGLYLWCRILLLPEGYQIVRFSLHPNHKMVPI